MPALLPSSERLHLAPFGKRRSTTILLVDDDPLILRLLAEVLISDGYNVLPCSSGAAAAATFRANGHIDLLLTDFQMPGMTGIELANLLTGTRPELSVLLVSGAPEYELPLWELWRKKWCFLAKPFNASLLLKTVDHLCGHEPSHLQEELLRTMSPSA